MLYRLLCAALIVSICIGDEFDDEYVDSVINMLLNGASMEFAQSNEIDDGAEPVLSGGIWKCGNCDKINESRLMYTEVNEVDDHIMDISDSTDDSRMSIQLAFTLPGMQCITVQSNTANVVRRVAGACTSGAITLSVAPAAHFTVHVYN